MLRKVFLFLLLILVFPLQNAFAIVVSIKNEFKAEDEGAILEVSSVKGWGIPNNVKVTIAPGETRKVIPKNIHSFVISRVYGEAQDKYQINCIEDRRSKDIVILTYDEIQAAKLPDGCKISKKGRWTLTGGTIWEEKKSWRQKINKELN